MSLLRSCLPSRTRAVWCIPGDDLHLLGLVKQETRRSGGDWLQWILSRKIFFVEWGERFWSGWSPRRGKLAFLSHTADLQERTLPLCSPLKIRDAVHILHPLDQSICKQTGSCSPAMSQEFYHKKEIKLASCSPAFDFWSKYTQDVSHLVLLRG